MAFLGDDINFRFHSSYEAGLAWIAAGYILIIISGALKKERTLPLELSKMN